MIDAAIVTLGGLTVTSLIGMGKMVYNYGRDRKELNGTVDRVKSIETKLDAHIKDESRDFKEIRSDVSDIKTKVDLLIDHKIKE